MVNRAPQLIIAAILLPILAFAQSPSPSDAMALEQQQKWAEAAQAWKGVTASNPNDAAAFAAMGVDLSRLQRYSEAAAAYRKALTLNPHLPGIELNLGLAEYKQHRWSAAATAFRAVLAADPAAHKRAPCLALATTQCESSSWRLSILRRPA